MRFREKEVFPVQNFISKESDCESQGVEMSPELYFKNSTIQRPLPVQNFI
jgi:hypothetical protein